MIWPGDLYDLSPEQAKFCRDFLSANRMVNHGPYTPMLVEGNALTFPSTLGGGNWVGLSFDPALHFVFTYVLNLGQWGHMVPNTDAATGQVTYARVGGASGAFARFWNPANRIPCTKPPVGAHSGFRFAEWPGVVVG